MFFMSARHVVIIEDNPGDVFLIRLALQENDIECEVSIFDTGQDAIEALCSQQAKTSVADVILLDLNTPKSDGFEVLARFKQTPHLARVPVAVITSSQAASDRARAERMGAARYLQKASQLSEFLTTVGTAVKELMEGPGAKQTGADPEA